MWAASPGAPRFLRAARAAGIIGVSSGPASRHPGPQRLPTGRSFNGRTRGSGPRYRGSNPCLPARLRSPFGRASSRSARSARRRTSCERVIRRSLSRQSPRSGRRRTSCGRFTPFHFARPSGELRPGRLALLADVPVASLSFGEVCLAEAREAGAGGLRILHGPTRRRVCRNSALRPTTDRTRRIAVVFRWPEACERLPPCVELEPGSFTSFAAKPNPRDITSGARRTLMIASSGATLDRAVTRGGIGLGVSSLRLNSPTN